MTKLKDKLLTLPKKPGCYQMKDKNGKIIYVGKAINLKNRVNSYFRGAHDYKTTKLVSNIVDFDYIVTKSEKEALILEYNLIKEYDPIFNIVFKDDKSYPYILLSDEQTPFLSVVRLKKNSKYKGQLFGPYPDVMAARNACDLINKLYKTRKCEHLKKDLCLYYHIDQCLGYCKYAVDQNICEDIKASITSLLNGDVRELTNNLKTNINEASANLDFEKAIKYRDLLKDVEHIILRQDVQISNRESFDVFSYAVKDGYLSIVALFVKQGRLLNSHHYMDFLVGDVENAVSSYIYQFYQINPEPKSLYVDDSLYEFLCEAFDFPVKTVTRGHKKALLKQAHENAMTFLEQKKSIVTKSDNYYNEVASEFKRIFKKDIERIEMFDNSHTAGHQTVASMIVYENFKPNKKEYRLFKLEDSGDDLKSMHEVLYRRYFKVLKDDLKRPDLLVVDGAKTQIKVANEIIQSLGLDITVIGLGKDEHHNTSYLMNSAFEVVDIKKDSNLFFFLTNMQDEVHRFAITYHRKLRNKAMTKSILDDIPGLGEKRKTLLRRHFKTISAIKEASVLDLSKVIPQNVAETLYDKLHPEKEQKC